MKLKKCISALLFLIFPLLADAQFYVTGDDPGRLKWYSIDTDAYRIIYPEGGDSLARVYASNLQKDRIPVSRTTGYLPGGEGCKKMPVVLHAYNTSNGSVAWAPKRMDLFTVPSAYNPEPMPWATMLSVHESRHVTQMQFGLTQAQRPMYWAFGEMWNILASLLYPGLSNIEGDAVIAETAFTQSGRGRTADFLNYYMVAFDNGDFRRWDQWRLGSQRRYAPDHYALGYMTIGGLRTFHNAPMFMSEAYHLAARNPINLGAFYTTTKKMTGMSYSDAFQETCHRMHDIWKEETAARAPFMPMEPVTKEPRLYADYGGLVFYGEDLYAKKEGHETTPMIVRIEASGKEHQVTRLPYETSKLAVSERFGRLYWSERKEDERWSMKADSKIRYVNVNGSGKANLTNDKRLLFNPVPNSLGVEALTVQYNVEGGSSLTTINLVSGGVVWSTPAPDSLQLVQSAWLNDEIYATAISDGGYGVYHLSGEKWSLVLGPQPVMIKDFGGYGDELIFTCDRTGVNELYHFNPLTGELRQKTVTPYGADNFVYSEDGKWLYCSSQTIKGKKVFRTPVDSLVDRKVDFNQKHRWVLAEMLAEQEREIAAKSGDELIPAGNPTISEPKRYRKFPHAFNIHSWAPVYVNVDNIMNMSYDYSWQAASLGATAIMQNRLATGVGEFGYSAHKDPYNPAKWRHSGHAKYTYSGLYPVFEAKVDFNDRAAMQWTPTIYQYERGTSIGLTTSQSDKPYVEGRLSMYIPFNLSSGGWLRGFIPKVTYKISNDFFNTCAVVIGKTDYLVSNAMGGGWSNVQTDQFMGTVAGSNKFRHSITASLRGYTMLPVPNSAVYPRWGIGAEIGMYRGIESSAYISPVGYAYLYGYIPGLLKTHGIKLSLSHQTKLNQAPFGQGVMNILPRGLNNNAALLNWLTVMTNKMTKTTVDYAFPIYIGDLAIGGNFFSIKRLVVNPHFDYTYVGGTSLFSVGGELILDMHSILTLEWPCSIGVTCSYNGGAGLEAIAKQSNITIDRFFVGPTFNVTF